MNIVVVVRTQYIAYFLRKSDNTIILSDYDLYMRIINFLDQKIRRDKLWSSLLMVFIFVCAIQYETQVSVANAAILLNASTVGTTYVPITGQFLGAFYGATSTNYSTAVVQSANPSVSVDLSQVDYYRIKVLSGAVPSYFCIDNTTDGPCSGYHMFGVTPTAIGGGIYEWTLTGSRSGNVSRAWVASTGACVLDGNSYDTRSLVFNGTGTFNNSGAFASQLCDSGGCSGGFNTATDYYSQIKNTTSGYSILYSASSTSSSNLKRLPEDWIVYVATTTDKAGNLITSDGYNWYQVIDPTDNVTGWMKGENASSTVHYLPLDSSLQTAFSATSSDYVATSSRPNLILNIIDHYYNDSNTSDSLYSSDDGPTGYKISHLKGGGYPEKLIWGIIAQESGGTAPDKFDNENITSDYGHGVMQITFSPSYPFDNRGQASNVKLLRCALDSGLYTNCYTDSDASSPYYRHYQPYAGNSNNPTYKQYSNTEQSIYANIKDGLYVLAHNYYVFSYINTSTTTAGVTYSADERRDILATQYYNGGNDDACRYVDAVADRLDAITSYFPTATTSDISTLIGKMHSAGTDVICANLHSPADLTIRDSQGRMVGVVNGKEENSFPLAVYDRERKFANILAANDENYTYEVVGTGNGEFGFDITIKNGNREISFKDRKVPIVAGEKYIYTVDKKALLLGQDGIMVQVDPEGNGNIVRTYKTGSKQTTVTYLSKFVPPQIESLPIHVPEVYPKTTPFEIQLEQAPQFPVVPKLPIQQ